jgi:hypothetical protein
MQYVSILRHFPTRLAGLRRVFNTASQLNFRSNKMSKVKSPCSFSLFGNDNYKGSIFNPVPDFLMQQVRINGFGDIIIHADLLALFTVAFHGMGR